MFHCIRNHLIVTVIYYVVVVVGLRFVSMTMQVSLNYLAEDIPKITFIK